MEPENLMENLGNITESVSEGINNTVDGVMDSVGNIDNVLGTVNRVVEEIDNIQEYIEALPDEAEIKEWIALGFQAILGLNFIATVLPIALLILAKTTKNVVFKYVTGAISIVLYGILIYNLYDIYDTLVAKGVL